MTTKGTVEIVEDPAAVLIDNDGNKFGTLHIVKHVIQKLPLWSQRDPRWKDVKLGYGNTTIGGWGCLLTDFSMALTHALQELIDPPTLNERLKEVDGFTKTGNANRIYWTRVTKAYPSFQFIERGIYPNDPAPVAKLEAALKDGKYVIVQIDFDLTDPDVDEHWLLLVGGDANRFLYHDPWIVPNDQVVFSMPPGYCKQGWLPSRAITAHAIYGVSK